MVERLRGFVEENLAWRSGVRQVKALTYINRTVIVRNEAIAHRQRSYARRSVEFAIASFLAMTMLFIF
ncbi:hypothetical protein HYN43_004835 [Mucilaginibacter celer]|uniref:Uncharacterized protein n=1 Tax=Mucilaginibacter celer TaxID=2305508 RepID=A0A494VTJ6_9SPHI|nr:hypothetical protein HYN43_004835 [Mucilaginibacter celer]